MSWNHRVLKRIHKEDGITYWVCEAAYKDGVETIPTFVTEILEMVEQELGDDMYSERL